MNASTRSASLNLLMIMVCTAMLVARSEAAPAVVFLEPVHVVVPRARVVQLPAVEITGTRAQRSAQSAVALPRVDVVVQRRAAPHAVAAASSLQQQRPL